METTVVERKEDADFLFEVYASSRVEEMSLWGWTNEQQAQFLRMQHEAQQRFYQQQYPDLQYHIIWDDGKKTGRVAIGRMEEELVLVDIILLPEFQNRGLGSTILQQLKREAMDNDMSIRLSVLTNSRAQQFYERFGFQVFLETGIYSSMKFTREGEGL